MTALDASPGLLAIARQRLPGADVREGDPQALPFADASFGAVVAVNSVFYGGLDNFLMLAILRWTDNMVNRAAMAHSGEAAAPAVYANADRGHMRPHGCVWHANVFHWIAGERPQRWMLASAC